MTKAEIEQKTREKIDRIQALYQELNVRVEARQKISGMGFIENQVVYIDNEQYPRDEAPVPATDKKDAETATQ